MPRDLPVGNGNLLISFDTNYNIRDIYYPYVGKENHTEGCLSRTGVWVEGRFAWLDNPQWQKKMVYEQETMVTKVTATNKSLGLTLTFHDAVDLDHDIFLRQVDIVNHEDRIREVRLFFHYDFRILGNDIGDTIYFHPQLEAVIAYKEQRYFLASGKVCGKTGVDHWTTASNKPDDSEGAVHDAEDGRLERVPLAFGFVEGVIGLYDEAVPAKGNSTIYHWLAVSDRFHGVEYLHNLVREHGPESFITRTRDYWRAWVNKAPQDFANLRRRIVDHYKRSLLSMRTQIDNRGAIIASSDADVLIAVRDTYAYVWPRDGALIAVALDMAGYSEITQKFFQFCANIITSEGYFLHKYTPDGALACHWMPWADEKGDLQHPIQEDETALVLYSLWQHYDKYRDVEFIRPLYQRLIKNPGDFMVRYREPHTRLPAPSYDVWEEHRSIHSFTIGTVWAGLEAAANFTELFGELDLARTYRQAAAEIKTATIEHLFDKRLGRFLRSINVATDGTIEPDHVIDSSTMGLFLFGMFLATDPRIEATISAIKDRLWCQTKVGGLARYEGDRYHHVTEDTTKVPGNPWFVCTMWLAEYYIARAKSVEELNLALEIFRWAQDHSLPSRILPEQVHPYTNAPLSVSPLTWSHAAVVTAVQKYLKKYRLVSGFGGIQSP